VIGGRYAITKRDTITVLIPVLHRDTSVWGDDVEEFRPERFESESFAKMPPNAWKPFGNGQRACIGRPFAMQEAVLLVAMILQRFDLIENDPSYQLQVAETLTLKPHGFRIRVKRRGSASVPAARRGAAASRRQAGCGAGTCSRRRRAGDAAARPLRLEHRLGRGVCRTHRERRQKRRATRPRSVRSTITPGVCRPTVPLRS
jgi:cytochrome P450/NADPH-cytochrome P450 reductase